MDNTPLFTPKRKALGSNPDGCAIKKPLIWKTNRGFFIPTQAQTLSNRMRDALYWHKRHRISPHFQQSASDIAESDFYYRKYFLKLTDIIHRAILENTGELAQAG